MNLKLEFDVTVTQHESGAFLASCEDFPRKVGIGDTPEEALNELRAHILRPVLQPITPPLTTANPWADLAEAFRDTPLLNEWREELMDRRRQSVDAEREPS